jgi:hypothetical protein
VLIGVAFLLCLLAQPLFGGRPSRLAELRIRLAWLAAGALGVQILIISVLPGGDETLYAALHVATYGALGVVVAANLRLPGLWLIAAGGFSNALVIVANGGVMPASRSALERAGIEVDPGVYTNSGVIEGAHLAFLGDVMGVPSWFPLANAFSIGDVLLVLGGAILISRVSGARLPWRRPGGPALVLFDAAGVVAAATPEARALLRRLAPSGIASPLGVHLPPEAFVVVGRARSRAQGRTADRPEMLVLDRAGRPLTLSASCLDGGRRVALAIARA